MADEGRTQTLKLRVSPDEKDALVAEAAAAGKSVSDYLRDSGLPRPERPAPSPEDADFIVRRAAQLEREGLPGHSARIVAARERHRAGHRIGDLFNPRVRRDDPAKRAKLTALREAFAKEVGRGSAA